MTIANMLLFAGEKMMTDHKLIIPIYKISICKCMHLSCTRRHTHVQDCDNTTCRTCSDKNDSGEQANLGVVEKELTEGV